MGMFSQENNAIINEEISYITYLIIFFSQYFFSSLFLEPLLVSYRTLWIDSIFFLNFFSPIACFLIFFHQLFGRYFVF